MRTLPHEGHEPIGLDVTPSAFTREVGSITDRPFVRARMRGVQPVVRKATLHKPHVARHSRRDYVEVNVSGT
jgi:UDP-glucose 4-epimerase